MVGELQEAIRLNQVQSLKGHRQKEQMGDSDMAETLVHTPRCVFTVVQEKDELSVWESESGAEPSLEKRVTMSRDEM